MHIWSIDRVGLKYFSGVSLLKQRFHAIKQYILHLMKDGLKSGLDRAHKLTKGLRQLRANGLSDSDMVNILNSFGGTIHSFKEYLAAVQQN